jgi:hypothetical protein
LRLDVQANGATILAWQVCRLNEDKPVADSVSGANGAKIALCKNFEFSLPIGWLVESGQSSGQNPKAEPPRMRLRFSLWQNDLPVDSLPDEGCIELQLLTEPELAALAFS